MTSDADNARDKALIAFYEAITESVEKEAQHDSSDIRIRRLKDLAEAYAHVTFGAR